MPFDLGMIPSGHFHCFSAEDAAVTAEPAGLREAFARDPGEGLFTLAVDKAGADVTPTLRYSHDFAGAYLGRRCARVGGETEPGPAGLQMSTLRRRVNQGEWVAAGPEQRRWVYGGWGEVLPGLVVRQEAETGLLAN